MTAGETGGYVSRLGREALAMEKTRQLQHANSVRASELRGSLRALEDMVKSSSSRHNLLSQTPPHSNIGLLPPRSTERQIVQGDSDPPATHSDSLRLGLGVERYRRQYTYNDNLNKPEQLGSKAAGVGDADGLYDMMRTQVEEEDAMRASRRVAPPAPNPPLYNPPLPPNASLGANPTLYTPMNPADMTKLQAKYSPELPRGWTGDNVVQHTPPHPYQKPLGVNELQSTETQTNSLPAGSDVQLSSQIASGKERVAQQASNKSLAQFQHMLEVENARLRAELRQSQVHREAEESAAMTVAAASRNINGSARHVQAPSGAQPYFRSSAGLGSSPPNLKPLDGGISYRESPSGYINPMASEGHLGEEGYAVPPIQPVELVRVKNRTTQVSMVTPCVPRQLTSRLIETARDTSSVVFEGLMRDVATGGMTLVSRPRRHVSTQTVDNGGELNSVWEYSVLVVEAADVFTGEETNRNCYVQLAVGTESFRTDTICGDDTKFWREDATFQMAPRDLPVVMRVKLMQANEDSNDKGIGYVDVPLEATLREPLDRWYPIMRPSGRGQDRAMKWAGQIHLQHGWKKHAAVIEQTKPVYVTSDGDVRHMITEVDDDYIPPKDRNPRMVRRGSDTHNMHVKVAQFEEVKSRALRPDSRTHIDADKGTEMDLVTIKIIEADEMSLPKGKPVKNPYCVVGIDGKLIPTAVSSELTNNDSQCSWNEKFVFHVEDYRDDEIIIQLFDRTSNEESRLLGMAMFDMIGIEPGGREFFRWVVLENTKCTGRVHVSVSVVPGLKPPNAKAPTPPREVNEVMASAASPDQAVATQQVATAQAVTYATAVLAQAPPPTTATMASRAADPKPPPDVSELYDGRYEIERKSQRTLQNRRGQGPEQAGRDRIICAAFDTKGLRECVLAIHFDMDAFSNEVNLIHSLRPCGAVVDMLDCGTPYIGEGYIAFSMDRLTLTEIIHHEEVASTQAMGALVGGMVKSLSLLHGENFCHCSLSGKAFVDNLDNDPNHNDLRLTHLYHCTAIGSKIDLKGPNLYSPPEIVRYSYYGEGLPPMASPAIDTWSVGMLVAEIWLGRHMLSGLVDDEAMATISSDDPLTLPQELVANRTVHDFVSRALNKNPKKRMTVREMMDHPLLLEGFKSTVKQDAVNYDDVEGRKFDAFVTDQSITNSDKQDADRPSSLSIHSALRDAGHQPGAANATEGQPATAQVQTATSVRSEVQSTAEEEKAQLLAAKQKAYEDALVAAERERAKQERLNERKGAARVTENGYMDNVQTYALSHMQSLEQGVIANMYLSDRVAESEVKNRSSSLAFLGTWTEEREAEMNDHVIREKVILMVSEDLKNIKVQNVAHPEDGDLLIPLARVIEITVGLSAHVLRSALATHQLAELPYLCFTVWTKATSYSFGVESKDLLMDVVSVVNLLVPYQQMLSNPTEVPPPYTPLSRGAVLAKIMRWKLGTRASTVSSRVMQAAREAQRELEIARQRERHMY